MGKLSSDRRSNVPWIIPLVRRAEVRAWLCLASKLVLFPLSVVLIMNEATGGRSLKSVLTCPWYLKVMLFPMDAFQILG